MPFGVSANYMILKEHHKVEEARLNMGFPIPPINNIGDVEANVQNYAVRADAWLLPFLDVFVLGGYTKGDAELDLPLELKAQAAMMGLAFPGSVDFEGPTYGGGLLVAGGYKELFTAVEVNYTDTDLNLLNTDVRTWVVDPRVGWRHACSPGVVGSIWVGAMYQECQETFHGQVGLGGSPVRFSVDQSSKEPWNVTLGTRWELNNNWSIMAEAGGLADRKQLTVSLGSRF